LKRAGSVQKKLRNFLSRPKVKRVVLCLVVILVLALAYSFVHWLMTPTKFIPVTGRGRRGPILPPLKVREQTWLKRLAALDQEKLIPYMEDYQSRFLSFEVNVLRPAFTPKIIGVIEPTPASYVEPDTEDDYLRNTRFNNHMDARWGIKHVSRNYTIMGAALTAIFKGWSRFCEEHDLIYWLAHGTLLGWSWNQYNLPWDVDIDIQTTLEELRTKMVPLNQTEHEGRFFFDVNPHFVHRGYQTGTNKIDARYIDMRTGLYIDITAVALNVTNDLYQCKSIHYHRGQDLFPLQHTFYEGVVTWIPNNVTGILLTEYGRKVGLPVFRVWRSDTSWYFNLNVGLWLQTSKIDAMRFLTYVEKYTPVKNLEPLENASSVMDFYVHKDYTL